MIVVKIVGIVVWLSYIIVASLAAGFGKNKAIGIAALTIAMVGAVLSLLIGHVVFTFIGMSIGSKLLLYKASEVF